VAKVVVVAPEVLRIVDHLRRVLSGDELVRVTQRVLTADEQTRGLSRAQRIERRVRCPLLVEDACSIHPVRPLICRGWTSLDRGACERHFADPSNPVAPDYAPAYELGSAVLAGLGQAVLDSGRDGRLLELNAALRIALERGNAAERWNDGRHVFETAVDQEARSQADAEAGSA